VRGWMANARLGSPAAEARWPSTQNRSHSSLPRSGYGSTRRDLACTSRDTYHPPPQERTRAPPQYPDETPIEPVAEAIGSSLSARMRWARRDPCGWRDEPPVTYGALGVSNGP
jgi:hypothetical protein